MSDPHDDHLTRAQTELGEPELLFQVGRGRLLAKLAVGLGLLVYGAVANALWWGRGQFGFGVVEKFLLFVPPLFGVALLWHMYRNRGLYVLVYPSGLLRLRRGEVDSFPWADIDHVTLKVQRAAPVVERDHEDGPPTACWLDAEVPAVKIWEAGLTVVRDDRVEARLDPALTDYGRLAEEVQRRTFAALWPAVWAAFRAGRAVEFGDLTAAPDGLRRDGRFLPWGQVREVAVVHGRLTIKQDGRWAVWLIKDVADVPNPHVLAALVEEARRRAPALPPVAGPAGGG